MTVGPRLAMSLRILRLQFPENVEDISTVVLALLSQFSEVEQLSLVLAESLSLEQLLGGEGDEDEVACFSLRRFRLKMPYKGGPPEEVLQAEKLIWKFPFLRVAIWEHKDIFGLPVSDTIQLS